MKTAYNQYSLGPADSLIRCYVGGDCIHSIHLFDSCSYLGPTDYLLGESAKGGVVQETFSLQNSKYFINITTCSQAMYMLIFYKSI